MLKRIAILMMLLAVPVPALALDDVVLINRASVIANGGFPYIITQPGSYRLSGNLTVPTIDTTAIVIASDNVTIDLGGFAIIGPADCAGGPLCGDGLYGTGHGISAGSDNPAKMYSNITVRNGTIRGVGGDAIHLLAESVLVEYIHASGTLLSGIVVRSTGVGGVQGSVILRHNNIHRTGSYGIKVYAGLISENAISEAGDPGISVQVGGASVRGNIISRGHSYGMVLTPLTSYVGNTMTGNAEAPVAGGVNLGENLCDGVVCP